MTSYNINALLINCVKGFHDTFIALGWVYLHMTTLQICEFNPASD